MEEKQKKGPGDIRQLDWREAILTNPEYMIGSLTPDPTGKQPCEGACNAFREIIDNAIDVLYDNPDSTTIIVDTENFNGYNFVADDSWGIPIKMSEVPGKTMAHLSISALNSGSKFNGKGDDAGAHIGRHGVGSSVTNCLSSEYILLSKITQENYDKSIPAVRELWESQGPRSRKDLFYIVVYENYGNLAFEGAMKLSDINNRLGVNLPTGMSTMVLFKLGTQYVPDPRVVIPYDNLNYFLLIMKEFYKRKVRVIANGVQMTAADLDMYKFKIMKTIIPEDTSKNKEVKVLIYFDVDPEMSSKSSYGSVNGLVVNTGLHINYVEACFDQALRAEYKITHKYTMNGFKSCIVLLAEAIGFDSQTKVRLKSIGKVKQSDFTDALVKEFVKIFRNNPEYWEDHVSRLNAIYDSMRSITAAEKVQKMIEDAQGRNMFKSKADLIPGFSDATCLTNRWNAELFLCFTGDTEILTCNNERISFVDLVKRMENGEEFYTFSCTSEGIIKPAKIIASKKIKQSTKIATVTLDNGEVFRCTPDHMIMLKTGEYVEAGNLKEGDSLMPCYIREIVETSNLTNKRFKENTEFHRRVVKSYKTDGYYRPYKMCDSGDNTYEYYVYRIMSTHEDSIKHDSYLNLKDNTKGVTRHHIDHNSLNDYPNNLMWCSSSWHGAHHGTIALHNKAKEDPELYKKIYVDPKNTEEYKKNHSEKMNLYYSTEMGENMKENLRTKANIEWSDENLRKWRSEETRKYALNNPDWVKSNTEKSKKTVVGNSVETIINFIKSKGENISKLDSRLFNRYVFLYRLENNLLDTPNPYYYDGAIKYDPNVFSKYGDCPKVSLDDPKYIRSEIILERLVDKNLEITEKNFNNEVLSIFKEKVISQGKGYISSKKKFPDLFNYFESNYNKNHKVVSVIIEDKVEDVYCLEVDTPEHNFPLAAGVFVKNCEGLSPAGSLKGGRHDTSIHAVLPLRGKILSVEDKSMEQAMDNKEIFTIFRVIGLGMGDDNITKKANSPEEAYELIKKNSRYGKIIIAVD